MSRTATLALTVLVVVGAGIVPPAGATPLPGDSTVVGDSGQVTVESAHSSDELRQPSLSQDQHQTDPHHQQTTPAQQDDEYIQDCAANTPVGFADPEDPSGVIGFVDGIWYNEPLSITTEDGINRTELDPFSKRVAARYEAMRCWNMPDGVPEIEIRPREEVGNSTGTIGYSQRDERFQDTIHETLLIIGSDQSFSGTVAQNRGGVPRASYNFAFKVITVVVDDEETIRFNESLLAHELGHAMQDQLFDLSKFRSTDFDTRLGYSSLIEGDAQFIQHRYRRACEEQIWDQPCLSAGNTSSSPEFSNVGFKFSNLFPYNDGPELLQQRLTERYDGDWAELDKLYGDPPESAYEAAYPAQLGELRYRNLEFSDESNDEWERLPETPEILGIAHIAAMFMRPTFEENASVWDRDRFVNTDDGESFQFEATYEYAHPETKGWRKDRIYVYRNGDNETAAVWKLAYASAESRDAFLDSYRELITNVSGGQRVAGYADTYTFEQSSKFDMALAIVTDGNRITIVKAPTVDDLTAVHDIELQGPGDTATPTPEPTRTQTPTDTPAPDDDTTESPTDNDGTGFGLLAGAVAVLVGFLVVRRRR